MNELLIATKEEIEILKMEICIYSSNFIKQITNESLTYILVIFESGKIGV